MFFLTDILRDLVKQINSQTQSKERHRQERGKHAMLLPPQTSRNDKACHA